MSGTTVAAVGTSAGRKPAVYVFTEPASGWSGVIQETARIPLAVVGLQLSGRTIVAYGAGTRNAGDGYVERAPVRVLRRPAGGWAAARPPHPSGYVVATDDDEDVGLEPGTLAGGTVALSNVTNCDQSQHAPCLSTVYALDGLGSAPDATAQLPIGASLSLRDSDGTPIVGDGSTLALGADGDRPLQGRPSGPGEGHAHVADQAGRAAPDAATFGRRRDAVLAARVAAHPAPRTPERPRPGPDDRVRAHPTQRDGDPARVEGQPGPAARRPPDHEPRRSHEAHRARAGGRRHRPHERVAGHIHDQSLRRPRGDPAGPPQRRGPASPAAPRPTASGQPPGERRGQR